MPGPKTNLFIPLGVGIRTDVDDKLLPLGNVVGLENAFCLRSGEIVKRYGGAALGTTTTAGGTLRQPHALGAHSSGLVSFSTPGIEPASSWSPTGLKWAGNRGTLPVISSDRRGPLRATRQQLTSDGRKPTIAYSSGYFFVGYQTLSATHTIIHHQVIIDATTGEQLFARAVNTTLAQSSQVVVIVQNTYAVFCYQTTGGNISFDRWTIAALASPANQTAGAGDSGFSARFDALADGGRRAHQRVERSQEPAIGVVGEVDLAVRTPPRRAQQIEPPVIPHAREGVGRNVVALRVRIVGETRPALEAERIARDDSTNVRRISECVGTRGLGQYDRSVHHEELSGVITSVSCSADTPISMSPTAMSDATKMRMPSVSTTTSPSDGSGWKRGRIAPPALRNRTPISDGSADASSSDRRMTSRASVVTEIR